MVVNNKKLHAYKTAFAKKRDLEKELSCILPEETVVSASLDRLKREKI